ncbi:MAG: hypothetical protein Q9M08_05655 [Mariprofundus sp.]|nr:hypothetical protein [Mariprofundus sp.]
MEYQKRLYQILYPNNSLVASQLTPEQFGKHFLIGTARHYEGKIIFTEVDADFRHDFFKIEEGFTGLVPHEDGRPKATKFISSYRVLEHIDLDTVKSLYLVTSNGLTLELTQGKHDKPHQSGLIRTYAQICPTTVLSMTKLNAGEYAQYMTRPSHSKWVPKLFFTQVELPIKQFLKEFEERPFMSPPFPFVHPAKLRDAILELESSDKGIKGISLNSEMEKIPYIKIRHGFWLSCDKKSLFFPMPDEETIKKKNYQFYKEM